MNRKLLILDVVLVAVLAYAGVQFRNMYLTSKAREQAQMRKRYPPVPVPAFPAAAPPPAAMAASYVVIPQKFLLDPSRNSTVVVDPPPPPPPPPPMPALPVYHGQMNLGDGGGLFAIMSVNKNSPHEAIHKGERIGEFTLVAVNRESIDLDWKGQPVHKNLYELTNHEAVQQAAAEASAQRPTPPTVREVIQESPKGPSEDNVGADGAHGCQANDSSPAGTVINGLKKVLRKSPFGDICSWQPVGTGGR